MEGVALKVCKGIGDISAYASLIKAILFANNNHKYLKHNKSLIYNGFVFDGICICARIEVMRTSETFIMHHSHTPAE